MVSMIRCDIHSVFPALSITHTLTHILTPTLNESDDICSICPFLSEPDYAAVATGLDGKNERERENASDISGS